MNKKLNQQQLSFKYDLIQQAMACVRNIQALLKSVDARIAEEKSKQKH